MEQRQVAPDRGHDAYARVRIAETGVDVHATDDGTAHGLLIRGRELSITIPRRGRLVPPNREGMGGGGHHRNAVLSGRLDDKPASIVQGRTQFAYRAAYLGIRLDLGT